MDQAHSHLHTLDVRWIEALSSQPYRHQNDEGLPGSVAAGLGGRLARGGVTQVHHILLVHCRSQEHHRGTRDHVKLPPNEQKLEVFDRSPVQSWATYTTRLWTADARATAFLEQEQSSDSYTDRMWTRPESGENSVDARLQYLRAQLTPV